MKINNLTLKSLRHWLIGLAVFWEVFWLVVGMPVIAWVLINLALFTGHIGGQYVVRSIENDR